MQQSKAETNVVIVPFTRPHKADVAFNRMELDTILKLYGRNVAAGEWRDYAIDHLADRAVFSIFRRSSEVPLYRIEKNPDNARKQGAYAVISAAGFVMKRGHDIAIVLKAIDKPKRSLYESSDN